MADRVAFFKTRRLGDFINGPETLAYEGDAVEFPKSGWAEMPTVTERAPGTGFTIKLTATYQRGHSSSETQRAFQGRILDAFKGLRDSASFGNGYTVGGELAIIEDTASDETQFVADEVSGSGVTVDITSDIGLAASDYVYLLDANATQSEVTQVSSPTSSSFVATLVNSWTGGSNPDSVFRVLYYFPVAYLTSFPEFPGMIGADNARRDLEFEFRTVQDPVHNL